MSSSRLLRSHRSTDAPMDFEYTSRPNTKPVWASSSDSSAPSEDPTTPKKRSHADLRAPAPPPPNPMFGQNQNIPFIFQTPPRPAAPPYPWAPPAHFSPARAFPPAREVRDVDMREASPPKGDLAAAAGGVGGAGGDAVMVSPEGQRKVATGGMRRILKQRMRSALSASTLAEADSASDSSDEDALAQHGAPQALSNHYTLNLPAPAAPPSDVPYVLLGYLQFFFNLSLIVLFLYLAVAFIWTVQRDVEERISEYSMDIVQDIAMCALQHKNNLCATPLPAMAHQCAIWATCMSRDPSVVGRAKVGAEMIAEVVNGFVEPISWKTLAFTLTSLAFLTLFINALLSLYRARHLHLHQPQAPAAAAGAHAGQFPMGAAAFPAHHFGGYLSPAPTPSWGRAGAMRSWTGQEEAETPTRRRRLEGGGAAKIK
ncbi:Di-sulfide bridge nucleocytoplasmic transport domain-containing protein [Mycena belliarum]|uniref:Di-sulfide bridge nucleocytoplasmic transport domain-containing protein n=1 Tax=Mycena belliarum TaxID=1033014 RepID=A0AAD6UGF1_9AGAR|nr:Di-sulfide bridge nucleocytoplasmic transport domain-containing protein [Mycena belliae]